MYPCYKSGSGKPFGTLNQLQSTQNQNFFLFNTLELYGTTEIHSRIEYGHTQKESRKMEQNWLETSLDQDQKMTI